MKRNRIISTILSVCMAGACMAGMSISASADTSLFDCPVIVDPNEQAVIVMDEDQIVSEDAYTLIFFSYTPTETGESLERVGTDFPTENGTYIATVTAKDGSGYTDAGRSEPFSIAGTKGKDLADSEITVDVTAQTVTVEFNEETVPESEYHIIYFSVEYTADGEKLDRIGEEFPTTDGIYIAGIVANEDGSYTGETRSDMFAISGMGEYNLLNSTVTVDNTAGTVTVVLDGETVPASEYHIRYFAVDEIEGGYHYVYAGTEFPTSAGMYVAGIVANEGSKYTGENTSNIFTAGAFAAGGEANPKTGAELPGLGVLAISAAAAVIRLKKRNK